MDLYFSEGKRLYCEFIDDNKAFDFVDRASLWSKMLDTQGKFSQVINNLYRIDKSYVSVNGKISDNCQSDVGLRQGENLSSLLFAISF